MQLSSDVLGGLAVLLLAITAGGTAGLVSADILPVASWVVPGCLLIIFGGAFGCHCLFGLADQRAKEEGEDE